jgi:hypothetical protein
LTNPFRIYIDIKHMRQLLDLNNDCFTQIIYSSRHDKYHISFGLTCHRILEQFQIYYRQFPESYLLEKQYCSCIPLGSVSHLSLCCLMDNNKKISFEWVLSNCDIIFLNEIVDRMYSILHTIYMGKYINYFDFICIFAKFIATKISIIPADFSIAKFHDLVASIFNNKNPIINISKFTFENQLHYCQVREKIIKMSEEWTENGRRMDAH